MADQSIVPIEAVQGKIVVIRGQKVLLDSDLANMYGVETKALIRAMKRNIERFPDDFMFQLDPQEFAALRAHFGTASEWGGRRTPPYAFTEQGVAMLSGVLRSPRAVEVNLAIMRAFVQLRQLISSNVDLARRLDELETVVRSHGDQFQAVFETFRQLLEPPVRKNNPIGFVVPDEKESKGAGDGK